ncbi:hypothetical protein U1Q18_033652 [Sarracenia purpurea var. burkii]
MRKTMNAIRAPQATNITATGTAVSIVDEEDDHSVRKPSRVHAIFQSILQRGCSGEKRRGGD